MLEMPRDLKSREMEAWCVPWGDVWNSQQCVYPSVYQLRLLLGNRFVRLYTTSEKLTITFRVYLKARFEGSL